MKKVVIPIPATDFDPTETAVTWKILQQNRINITFATPGRCVATGDHRMLTGAGLGIWKPILRADQNGLLAYEEMMRSKEFRRPIDWEEIRTDAFDGIVLPGGHAPGMKIYLESKTL